MSAHVLDTDPATPPAIHNCPSCSHWLPEGTLACPDCHTLTYGEHLAATAQSAQSLEQENKWAEAREQWRSALRWLPEDTEQAGAIQQHIAAIDRRFAAEEEQRARWSKRLGPLAPVAVFLLKAKSALFLLFKLKFLLSFLGFFAVYWAFFGWKFALGFALSLLIHEMGHYVAVKRRGMRAELPIFVPFMFARVRWFASDVSREDLAAISLAGPLYGLGAALGFMALAWPMHSLLLIVLANVTAWLNLLNLVPVWGLDGAKAVYALSRMQRGLIAALSLLLFGLTASISNGDLFSPLSPVQWVFAFVGVGMLWRTFSADDAPEQPHTGTMIYFMALIVVLGFVLLITHGQVAQISAMGSDAVYRGH